MDALVSLISNITVMSAILFIIGVALLAVEFFIPGFGVCGVLGIICLIVDMIVTAKSFTEAAIMFGFILFVVLVFVVLMLILGSKGKMPKFLVLGSSMNKEEGFSATADFSSLVGKTGKTQTALRPAGKVTIDGKNYDVVSDGEFIDAGVDVNVTDVAGNKITVAKL